MTAIQGTHLLPVPFGQSDKTAPPNAAAAAIGPAVFNTAQRAWFALRRFWWTPFCRMSVRGLEHVPTDGPVLLCANHGSHLDAAAILAALPSAVALRTRTAAAKDVFGDHRGRDLVARLTTNALPIQRQADFARGLRTLEAVLTEGRPLILFPEGRRSVDGELVEFKPGAAMLAVRTNTPIVPVRLDGVRDALPRGSFLPRARDVRVTFGNPINPAAYRLAVRAGEVDRRGAYDRMTADLRATIEGMRAPEARRAR